MPELISGLAKNVSGSIEATGSIIASFDATHYKSMALQLTGTWVATLVIEQSNNDTDFVATSAINANTGASSASFTTNGLYIAAITARFVRVRCSAYTSGTIVANGLISGLAFETPNANVTITADTEFSAAAALADATANPTTTLVGGLNQLFNNATWDRERGNYEETVLASAARTASINSADLVNYNARGIIVVIDATAITATPSIVATIKGKDTLSGKYNTILASAAITAVSTTVLKVGPALTAAANLVANDLLPRIWRVEIAAGDADSITYSIGANYIR